MSGASRAAWWVLVVSEAGAGAVALAMVVAPGVLPGAWAVGREAGPAVRAWGVTWLALTAVVLVVLVAAAAPPAAGGSAARGQRAVLVVVPAVWLSHAILAPAAWWNLVLAAATAVAVGVLTAAPPAPVDLRRRSRP